VGCVVFVGTSGSAGLVFSLFVCGVVSFVFWGIIAGCSTADMGLIRADSWCIIHYVAGYILYGCTVTSLSLCIIHYVARYVPYGCTVTSLSLFQQWVPLFCFLVRFEEFSVCSTWLFGTVQFTVWCHRYLCIYMEGMC
jgi:hypothetical protein